MIEHKDHPNDTTVNSSVDLVKVENSLEPFVKGFVGELSKDFPELAQELTDKRISEFLGGIQQLWQEFQESLRSNENSTHHLKEASESDLETILAQVQPDQEFITALVEGLNQLRYISKEAAELVMHGYASEIEHVLQQDSSLILLFESDYHEDGSETYFAKMVYKLLSPELQKRIRFSAEKDSEKNRDILQQARVVIYRFDDSSNSGSQVIASVRSFIRKYSKHSLPFDYRIRLIASGSEDPAQYVRERVDKWLNDDNTSIPDYSVESKQKYLNEKINMRYKGYSVSWGTSLVFAHKIQDNLPILFLSLDETHRRDKPHIFKMDNDIKPPYKP